jgi:hypothetical protein
MFTSCLILHKMNEVHEHRDSEWNHLAHEKVLRSILLRKAR